MLNVSLEKPPIPIKDAFEEVKAMYERLEPLNNVSIKGDLSHLYSQNPILLRTWDNVRKAIIEENNDLRSGTI